MGIQLVAVVVCIDSEASQIGAKRLRGATMATGRYTIKLVLGKCREYNNSGVTLYTGIYSRYRLDYQRR